MRRLNLVACLVAAHALLLTAAMPARAQSPTQISAGYAVAGEFLPLFIAVDEGYFAKRGLDVKPVALTVISTSPAVLMSGSLQLAVSNGPLLLQAVAGGIDLVVVSGSARHVAGHETVSLLARTGANIHSAADLVGKRVGVPGLRATYDFLLAKWLADRGVDRSKIQMIETPLPQMRDLLKSGQLDATVALEPVRGRIMREEVGYRVSDFLIEVLPDIAAGFWTATRGWSDANPKAVAAFQAGLAEGIRFIQEQPERANEIERKHFGIVSEVRLQLTQEVRPDDLKLFQDLMLERGDLARPLDLSKLILPLGK